MPDFKAAEGGRVGQGSFALLLNMSTQLALENGVEKGAHFILFPRGLKLHPAVRQIPHRTGYVEALGNLPDRPTEPDTLDVALV